MYPLCKLIVIEEIQTSIAARYTRVGAKYPNSEASLHSLASFLVFPSVTAAAGAGPFILAILAGVPCSWPGPEVTERLLRVVIFSLHLAS